MNGQMGLRAALLSQIPTFIAPAGLGRGSARGRRRRARHHTTTVQAILLKDKLAVVTGASRGIGQAISERLAREGARLALVARNEQQLKEVADSCMRHGSPSAEIYPVDLRNPELTAEFAQNLLAKHETVNILINNAGIMPKRDGACGNGDLPSWQAALQINVFAPMVLVDSFAPGMISQREGLIVNIASIAGVDPMAVHPVYCGCKFAIRGFSHSCYEALRHANVKVVCINPAPVDTDMATGRFAPERLLQPSDIAEAVMLAVTSSSQCIPQDVTLRLALSAGLTQTQ